MRSCLRPPRAGAMRTGKSPSRERVDFRGDAVASRSRARRPLVPILKRVFCGFDPDDFDFDRADILQSQILPIDLGDFLGEVALNRVEFGVGANLQTQHRVQKPPFSHHERSGRSDAPHLFAARFQNAMESVTRNLQPAGFILGEDEGLGPSQHDQDDHQCQECPDDGGLKGRNERGVDRKHRSVVGAKPSACNPAICLGFFFGEAERTDFPQSVAGASGQTSSERSLGPCSDGRRTPSIITSTLATFLPVIAMTCLRTASWTS